MTEAPVTAADVASEMAALGALVEKAAGCLAVPDWELAARLMWIKGNEAKAERDPEALGACRCCHCVDANHDDTGCQTSGCDCTTTREEVGS